MSYYKKCKLRIQLGFPSTFGTVYLLFVSRNKILFKVSSHLRSSINWLAWPTTFLLWRKVKKDVPYIHRFDHCGQTCFSAYRINQRRAVLNTRLQPPSAALLPQWRPNLMDVDEILCNPNHHHRYFRHVLVISKRLKFRITDWAN